MKPVNNDENYTHIASTSSQKTSSKNSKIINNEEQPCTSTSSNEQFRIDTAVEQNEREEIVQMWKHIDERLENKAKAMNLTSLNVKSILHHLIKYPNAIDVLLGIGGDSGVPNVRLTRSHRKPTENTMSVVFEELYGKMPSTFLDLNFDENDEFDDDYAITNDGSEDKEEEDEDVEDEDEVLLEEEEEEEEEILNGTIDFEPLDPFERLDMEEQRERERVEAQQGSTTHHENLNDSLVRKEAVYVPHMDNSYTDKTSDEFRTVVSDEYCEFLNAVFHDEQKEVPALDEDTDDEDYNVQMDADGMSLDVEDCDETRHDRTTEIPRDEVEKLMIDNILAEKEIPAEALPKEVITICEEPPIQKLSSNRKSQKQKDAEVAERIKRLNTSNESCSLINGKNVTFRQCEIKQLRVQLEQHVQLLTQFVVTCYCDETLQNIKNSAQQMINELESNYTKYGDYSIYNISNLASSIESCHHIMGMQKVDPTLVNWAANTDGFEGTTIRPEAIAVLSKSNAIRYPHLLPKVQPKICDSSIPFLRSEDMMLALALLQFVHLPRRGSMDRYTAISENCLPARSPNKIRNHMKTMRTVHEKSSPMHFIITQAEQGICKFEFPDPPVVLIESPIEFWPEEYHPNWYKLFNKHFVVKDECRIVLRDAEFGSVVVKPNAVEEHRPDVESGPEKEESYVRLGTVGNGKPIIIKKEQIADIIRKLFPEKEISPSKRRKNSIPVKISLPVRRSNSEESGHAENSNNVPYCDETLEDEEASSSFVRPPTPGNRPPSECDIFDSHSLGHLEDPVIPGSLSEGGSTMGMPIPATPRGFCEDSQSACFPEMSGEDKTDFAHFNSDPKNSQSNQFNEPCPSSSEQCVNIDENSDDDVESISRSDDFIRRKRKRSRIEKETMGRMGLEDCESKSMKRLSIARKIMSDVKKRLFMHQETWSQLVRLMKMENIDEKERVEGICKLLEPMPDILHLVVLFTPPQHLPLEILTSQLRYSYLAAVEMMLDIDAYITAAKMKTPTVRQIFKLISKFGVERLRSEDAAQKMYQILGHERPLWEKIERNFYCLAYRGKTNKQDFEFIDLTSEHNSNFKKEEPFECVDDINQVLDPSTSHECSARPNFMVKCGQLMAVSKSGLIPIEVMKNKWTKAYDMRLLTVYNQSIVENRDFNTDDLPKLLMELPFCSKTITDRLNYLLSML